MSRLMDILDRMPTINTDDDVVDAYATLAADCRRIGHALQGKGIPVTDGLPPAR